MNTKFDMDFAAFLDNIKTKLDKALTGMEVKAWLVRNDGLIMDMRKKKDLAKIIYYPDTKTMQISISRIIKFGSEADKIIRLECAAFRKLHKDMIKKTEWKTF
jgi:hypothetical protein